VLLNINDQYKRLHQALQGNIMQTIEQRRKTDRKRRERWRQRKIAQGCKQIQLMLTPEAQAILAQEKSRTGEPFVRIIHRAILDLDNDLPVTSAKKNKTQPNRSKKKKTQTNNPGKAKPRSKIADPKKSGQQDQLKLFLGSNRLHRNNYE
jgi:hypothetical protein